MTSKPEPPKKIAHIGIAVVSIAEMIPFYEQQLGLTLEGQETLESEQVKLAFFKVGAGDTRIELLEPLTETSPIAEFLNKKGPGIHHIAFEVENINARLEQLKQNGIRLIHEQAKQGSHRSQIAFLHPKSTGGALVELCQSQATAEEDKS